VITAVHTLIYSDDAEATRAFLRDVLGLPFVDAHDGWLIFGTGPSELGVHPAGPPPSGDRPPVRHEISLMCDDIEATVAQLRARGAEFTREIRQDGYGRTIELAVPGAGQMIVYQPRHPVAHHLRAATGPAAPKENN
jgi:catechol 2,3-dioxygenase-like lactoylglutathione lyase family enzyme